jgi:predicted esterase
VARGKTTAAGTHPLNLGESRDAILHLPPSSTSDPLPLMVLLHGASGSGDRLLGRLQATVSAAGVAVLAPDSRGSTWDALRTDFGRDVAFLDRALVRVFELVSVDAERIAIGGFSDGATYALSLGLINGDLFRKIVAFSPGFLIDGTPTYAGRTY